MRVAVVHDWLTVYAGAEKVLEQILSLFPKADLFTIVDFLPEKDRGFLRNHQVITSFIQTMPFSRAKYRNYLPFMPYAIEQLDVSKYDLVISSSHAVAKGIITGPDQIHICYCHSPMRYAWDLQHQYLSQAGLTRGIKSFIARAILHYIRQWDLRTVNSVDAFVANSSFIARRIEKMYRRDAQVIYPPVNIEGFSLREHKEDFYLTASRMVPYKRVDLIVEAFSAMPNKKLIVIGEGPDYGKVRQNASPNITFMGYQSFEVLRDHMQRARAFVFAAEEDFGIIPVEAQACGTPVIAYGKGGVLETVVSGESGFFFEEQTPQALIRTVQTCDDLIGKLVPSRIRDNAKRFSEEEFRKQFSSFVDNLLSNHGYRNRTSN